MVFLRGHSFFPLGEPGRLFGAGFGQLRPRAQALYRNEGGTAMKFPGFLSVVIPAYNEEKAVEEIVHRTRAVLKREKISHEIIVVDDGSQDATARHAEKAKAQV